MSFPKDSFFFQGFGPLGFFLVSKNYAKTHIHGFPCATLVQITTASEALQILRLGSCPWFGGVVRLMRRNGKCLGVCAGIIKLPIWGGSNNANVGDFPYNSLYIVWVGNIMTPVIYELDFPVSHVTIHLQLVNVPLNVGAYSPSEKRCQKIRNNHHKHRINIKTSVGGTRWDFVRSSPYILRWMRVTLSFQSPGVEQTSLFFLYQQKLIRTWNPNLMTLTVTECHDDWFTFWAIGKWVSTQKYGKTPKSSICS